MELDGLRQKLAPFYSEKGRPSIDPEVLIRMLGHKPIKGIPTGIAMCFKLANWGSLIMQGYELTDFEWAVITPLLPNKPRGVPRVDDRRVLNGIFWVLRTGAPWRALPKEFGPPTTCYNRFVRWRKAGVWDRILAAVSVIART